MINIAIDGPSGAGKSTVAKALAKELHFVYVDTGAKYRAIGVYVRGHGIDKNNADAVIAALPDIRVSLDYAEDGTQIVLLNGEDVSTVIRENEISLYASTVSKIPEVRARLLSLQREMAQTHNVIMDGRDIGTVVLPNACVKIFMSAHPEIRAKRRYKELLSKGNQVTYDDVYRDMVERDKNDSTRASCPCVPAKDAVLFDNSALSLEETLSGALKIIEGKMQ